MKRGIVIASFGDRDQWLTGLLKNLRSVWPPDLPILVLTDRTEPTGKHITWRKLTTPDKSPRRWIHLTNEALAAVSLYEEFDSVCCLNDDMRIVSEGALDGFLLAERFGVCVPLNPRVYAKYNALGADSGEKEIAHTRFLPQHAPAYNVSPMFVCKHVQGVRGFLETYRTICQFECKRGTLAFWWAMWRTGFCPMALPEQWCVCGSSAEFIRDLKKPLKGKMTPIEPMMLHWGQPVVRDVFYDRRND